MSKRIALVHAVKPAMQPIADAFRELWPEADCANILDDSLSRDRQKTAELTPAMYARFDALGVYAADIGADGLLFTCSAFGDAIDAVARKASFPVLKPNEAMFEAALERGRSIGMLATFGPSVASMEREFYALADARGIQAEIKTICIPEAMDALQTFGIDRIMFSVDYPFARDAQGQKFLSEVALAPPDMAKLCHGNADALLKLKP